MICLFAVPIDSMLRLLSLTRLGELRFQLPIDPDRRALIKNDLHAVGRYMHAMYPLPYGDEDFEPLPHMAIYYILDCPHLPESAKIWYKSGGFDGMSLKEFMTKVDGVAPKFWE